MGEGGVGGSLEPYAGPKLGGRDEARGLTMADVGVRGGPVELVQRIDEREPPAVGIGGADLKVANHASSSTVGEGGGQGGNVGNSKKGPWRLPMRSQTSYVRCLFEAMNFLLVQGVGRDKALPQRCADQVHLALQASLVDMIRNDLEFMLPDENGRRVCEMALASFSDATVCLTEQFESILQNVPESPLEVGTSCLSDIDGDENEGKSSEELKMKLKIRINGPIALPMEVWALQSVRIDFDIPDGKAKPTKQTSPLYKQVAKQECKRKQNGCVSVSLSI